MSESLQQPTLHESLLPGRGRPRLGIRILVYVLLSTLLACWAIGALAAFYLALCSGISMRTRVIGGVIGLALLFLLVRILWTPIRRRWTTGRWRMSAEELRESALKLRYPAWLRIFPARIRNEANDPIGSKFIGMCIWTAMTCSLIVIDLRVHPHGFNAILPVLWALIAVANAGSLYRRPRFRMQ